MISLASGVKKGIEGYKALARTEEEHQEGESKHSPFLFGG